MNILLLCNKSPYPPSEGGPMAMNSIITGLIGKGHKVKVMAFNSDKYSVNPDGIPSKYKEDTRIEFVDIVLKVNPTDAFKNLFTGESYHVQRFVSEEFSSRLVEVLKEEEFDIVQLEMVYMAPYIDIIRKYSRAEIVLRAHNLEHQIWERIAKKTRFFAKRWYINHLARTLKSYELNVIKKVDGIAAITNRDASFFRRVTSKPVIDVPFGVDIDMFKYDNKVKKIPDFYHIGSMNWMPNEEAVKWLLDNVWDKVVEREPEAKLYLAGRNMPQWLVKTDKHNVFVVGEVEDSHKFVSEHDVAVVPLLSGGGMRIKIIESMALGKTVISTMVGAEGIQYKEFENIIIADNADQMIEAMCRIMQDRDNAERIGANARRLIENVYDNDKIINRLVIFYHELLSNKEITTLN